MMVKRETTTTKNMGVLSIFMQHKKYLFTLNLSSSVQCHIIYVSQFILYQ